MRSWIVFGFTKKNDASRLPLNWPSHLHNKCDVQTCIFPNPPQVAKGKYNCRGTTGRLHCDGTYSVSSSAAASVVKQHMAEVRREFEARWKVQKAAEAKRQKALQRQEEDYAKRRSSESRSAKREKGRRTRDAEARQNASNEHYLPSSQDLHRRAVYGIRAGDRVHVVNQATSRYPHTSLAAQPVQFQPHPQPVQHSFIQHMSLPTQLQHRPPQFQDSPQRPVQYLRPVHRAPKPPFSRHVPRSYTQHTPLPNQVHHRSLQFQEFGQRPVQYPSPVNRARLSQQSMPYSTYPSYGGRKETLPYPYGLTTPHHQQYGSPSTYPRSFTCPDEDGGYRPNFVSQSECPPVISGRPPPGIAEVISIDGLDIEGLSRSKIQHNFSIVSQDEPPRYPFIWSRTQLHYEHAPEQVENKCDSYSLELTHVHPTTNLSGGGCHRRKRKHSYCSVVIAMQATFTSTTGLMADAEVWHRDECDTVVHIQQPRTIGYILKKEENLHQ
ncbi:hypothetical protein B0H34DRAFT_678951 [Crassisporium funariophilum]|nr:hypothetical protein B0H34DRAFT_678951 [Crassisporium funariophilum]